MNLIKRIINKLIRLLLSDSYFRLFLTYVRCFYFLKIKRVKVVEYSGAKDSISENTIFSNKRRVVKDQSKHPHPTAKYLFGIDLAMRGGKSDWLLYPVRAIPYFSTKNKKILTIGPRNESELFTILSHGFKKKNMSALDLFSYSPLIDVGDMHEMPYKDDAFDIILLGWVLAYSNDKSLAVSEIIRIAKDNAIISLGFTYSPVTNEEVIEQRGYLIGSEERVDVIDDMIKLFKDSIKNIYFNHDATWKSKEMSGQNILTFSITK